MRKTIQASVLVLALALSVYAGDMQFPIATPPPPSNVTVQSEILQPLIIAVLETTLSSF
jgi:hypothetical protein